MTEVTQAAKDAAAQFLCRDDGDFPELAMLFQTYGEHIAATARAEAEALKQALEKARKIIRDVEDYMSRPDRGDWGVECALCMGELFDDDREAIAAIDAALSKGPTQ